MIPGRTPWVDFIDADIFRGVPGASSPSVTVFVNSWAGGPHSNTECQSKTGCWIWNQVQFWVGETLSNGSFVPFTRADGSLNTGAVDYGNYGPSPITTNNSMGIDVAGLGGTQYYTCKTGQDLTHGHGAYGRRIMFAWLMAGASGAFPNTKANNVSVRALPRDITLRVNSKGDHEMLQAPVPELKTLRMTSGHLQRTTVVLSAEAGGQTTHPLPFESNQFELVATFRYASTTAFAFAGVRVMANYTDSDPSGEEAAQYSFAAVGIDMLSPSPGGLVVVDRTHSFFTPYNRAGHALPHDMGPDVGFDRPGNDVDCFAFSGSALECGARCDADAECLAWTLVQLPSAVGPAPCSAGRPLGRRYCTLKNKIAAIKPSQHATCGLPARSAGWLRNHTRPGHLLGDVRAGPLPAVSSADGHVEHRLHAFFDRSTAETFWDNSTTVSARVWPPTQESNRTALYLRCDRATACAVTVTIEAWRLSSTE